MHYDQCSAIIQLSNYPTSMRNVHLKLDCITLHHNTYRVALMITIVYGSILRPSSNNWASYLWLKWQIAALFL
jgi:hypothetical protein